MESEPLKWRLATQLLIVTGCRRGEIMGLKWEKIDFKTNQIRIDTALKYLPKVGTYEGSTKTGNTRTLYLLDETMRLLKQHRHDCLQLRIKNGDRWRETGYVFIRDDGSPMNPDSIGSWLSDFAKRHNLPHINPHAFRHPYVKRTTKKYFLQKQKSQTIKHTAMVWDSGFFNYCRS